MSGLPANADAGGELSIVPGLGITKQPALFNWRVSEMLGSEYVPITEDILRMLCIQATIQLMSFMSSSDAERPAFWTSDFVLLVVYVILGVMLYWLVLRRMFVVS
jgi:hypothetical protein